MTEQQQPIAIVGAGGLFPSAPDLKTFWRVVADGTYTAKEPTTDRWPLPAKDYFDCKEGAPDKILSTKVCTVDDIPLDWSGLNVSPEVVKELDPLFPLVFAAGKRAFADANMDKVDKARVGVTIANIVLPTDTTSDMSHRLLAESVTGFDLSHQGTLHPLNRFSAGLPAGFLAKSLGLGGGASTLDAACASSLYALWLACEELNAGRADAMLTGGACRPCCLYTAMGFSALRAYSRSGMSRPFDANCDGLIVGEGAGIFVLKRLADALRDGDKIYAVVKGVGLSNDRGGSLLAPDAEGQLRAMRQAYLRAGWRPSMVDLIECHGTATPVGDAVEFKSMATLWGEHGWAPAQCVIGSVKSNVGHLLTGAGAAGLMKVILAMKEKTLPPTANFETPNPRMGYEGSPFKVLSKSEKWERRKRSVPRRAAVSAFGFGGINAHVLLEEWAPQDVSEQQELAVGLDFQRSAGVTTVRPRRVDVAVVGIGTHVGSLDELRPFQEAVLSGKSAIEVRSKDRWFGFEETAFYKKENLSQIPQKGCFIGSLEFPFGRFRISPKEFEDMSVQQALMLRVVDRALDDAKSDRELGNEAGVFIGIGQDFGATNFFVRWALPKDVEAWAKERNLSAEETEGWLQKLRDGATPPLTAPRVTGNLGGIVASRVAREFSVGGPAFNISAEDNSGMKALEAALRALQRGELNKAVVGAVDLVGDLRNLWANDKLRPYSRSGSVNPLDESADGTMPGEGAVALVLKRLSDAKADGDRVYCVIRGYGQASDGGCDDVYCTENAYRSALERAYEDAACKPEEISYVETHGSGFPREDEVEAKALAGFFKREDRDGLPTCALGSVKSVVGHTGCAAGLVSLAKTALSLYQEVLPPMPDFEVPQIELSKNPSLHVPKRPQYWYRNRAEGSRKAGLSSMSIDGTCVHLVLEEHKAQSLKVETERRQPLGVRREALFTVEGADGNALITGLGNLQSFVFERKNAPIETIARQWFAKNGQKKEERLGMALVASDCDDVRTLIDRAKSSLAEKAEEAIAGGPPVHDRLFYSPRPMGKESELAFVFPGSGNYYLGMGLNIGVQWPEILRKLDEETGHLRDILAIRRYAPWRLDWSKEWQSKARQCLVDDHNALIYGHVAYGMTMHDLVRSFDINPQAIIGYSLGETAGYFATRTWTERDEMYARLGKSSLFVSDLLGSCNAARKAWGLSDTDDVNWTLGVIERPAEEVREAVSKVDKAYLLIVNAPGECVVGGYGPAVKEMVDSLGATMIPLDGVSTVHCEVAGQVASAYRELHLLKTSPPKDKRFYSHSLGRSYEVTREGAADSILNNALDTIDFTKVINEAYNDGVRIFVELGPRHSCSRMIGKILGDKEHVARTACREGQDSVSTVLRMLGHLVAERVPLSLDNLYGTETALPSHDISGYLSTEKKRAIVVPSGGRISKVQTPAAKPAQRKVSKPTYKAPVVPVTPAAPVVKPIQRTAVSQDVSHPVVSQFVANEAMTTMAHEAYLRLMDTATKTYEAALQTQMQLLGTLPPGYLQSVGDILTTEPQQPIRHETRPAPQVKKPVGPREKPVYDQAQCNVIATGKISEVFGPEFKEVDTYPTRVRLPDGPLNFVDRITHISGEKGHKGQDKLGAGRIVTEHDVLPGAWYLDNDRIPTGISVEAGQADLCLSGYLGIDFKTKGKAMYRLLDAVVTFHDHLPRVGDTIHYDIRGSRFIRQADTYLYFFEYDGTVNGKPYITMRNGTAGFFTPKQLAEGKGLIMKEGEMEPIAGKKPADWRELAPFTKKESYNDEQIARLIEGDLVGCFGPEFEGLPINRPLTFPGNMMRLIDRVPLVDPTGGRAGMGLIKAEIDIPYDAWFLVHHFCDDQVMPGTLMYESCMQAWKVFLLRMGWVVERTPDVIFEPICEVRSGLRCRGQVIPGTKQAQYEIHIKEIGYDPVPYAMADAFMYADGRPMVYCSDMSIQLTGASREQIEAIWGSRSGKTVHPVSSVQAMIADDAGTSGYPAKGTPEVRDEPLPAVYDRESILHYSEGDPSKAFGDKYIPFDRDKFLARLPRPPYLCLDRITYVEGTPFDLKAGGVVIGQYDIPENEWYFDANRQDSVPFSIILEYPLQICGWYAAYCGSALTSETELHFRNLDGSAILHEDLRRDAGTLTSRIRFNSTSLAGGMIIQKFDFKVYRRNKVVYEGDTVFGFFSEAALAQQVGVRGAKPYEPSEQEKARTIEFALDPCVPRTPYDKKTTPGSGLVLPAECYLMHDNIELFIPDGGPNGLGFLRGVKAVNKNDWFFYAHFYQDPVIPGSLGLEAFIQLLKVAAINRWGEECAQTHYFEPIAVGRPHTWLYRGQVIPKNNNVVVDCCIDSFEDDEKVVTGSGFLKCDGKVIYEMQHFAIRAVPK